MIQIGKPDIGSRELHYITQAVLEVELSTGRHLRAFERGLAEWTGHDHAVCLSSGTDALHLMLRCLTSGAGFSSGPPEVVVPSMTFAAVAAAVCHAGCMPVFAGVREDGCVDPDLVVGAMSDRTAAVVAVHSYGVRADYEGLCDAVAGRVPIVVDSSQGHGLRTPCDFEITSFHGNKILTCGAGGAALVNDIALAEEIRWLACHCHDCPGSFFHSGVGYNAKMTNLQAAVGLAQLERADELMANRMAVMDLYEKRLPIFRHDVPWLASVMVENRAEVMAALDAGEIEYRPWFPLLHEMPPYRGCTVVDRSPSVAERLSTQGLSLPTHGTLTGVQVDRVCDVVDSIAVYAPCES